MIIRQQCLLSYDELMKSVPKSKLVMILDEIDVAPVADKMKKPKDSKGPKGYAPELFLYALIAMQVEQIKTIAGLVKRLSTDFSFKYACGFGLVDSVPSESAFSRFLSKLSDESSLEELFHSLVLSAKKAGIIEGSIIAIDSTKLSAYEASKPKKEIIDDGKHPNWGMKRDTNGNKIRWFGWKLHILCDSKSELPLDIKITPANIHDGTVAISLIEHFLASYKETFKPSYYLMDSGYDYDYIYRDIINRFEAIPIIAYNPRGSKAPPVGLGEDLHPICSAGYKLVYWGKDNSHMKFRCRHVLGKVNCPFGSNWCSSSNYGYTLKINYKENPRQIGYPLRSSKTWKTLYNKRTSVERLNGRLKEHLNLNHFHSKGIKKAFTHSLLNSIAIIAGTIAVNKKHQNKPVTTKAA